MTLKKFRPANGTEGMEFMSRFCFACKRDAYFDGKDGGCSILQDSMAFQVDDFRYPAQLVIGLDGKPKCLAYNPMTKEEQTEMLERNAWKKAVETLEMIQDQHGKNAPLGWMQAYYVLLLRERGLFINANLGRAPQEKIREIRAIVNTMFISKRTIS